MDEISNNIVSPSWWFGVVFISLIVNLLSAYIKAPIDRTLSRISLAWRKRMEGITAARVKEVERLARDNSARQALWRNEVRTRIRIALVFTGAMFFLLFASLGQWISMGLVGQLIYVVLQLFVLWAMTLATVLQSRVKTMRGLLEDSERTARTYELARPA